MIQKKNGAVRRLERKSGVEADPSPQSILRSILCVVGVSGTSLAFLALLGGLAAYAGGAGVTAGAMRVTFWGALAMALTTGVGLLFRTVTAG
jgi:hypothetical protein